MGWATAYIARLKAGETVAFRPRGGSQRFQIGNNRGFINGWIGPNGIYGRCIKVEA